MNPTIEVKGLGELERRFRQYPGVFAREQKKAMDEALLHVWGSVPSYPSAPPNSTYVRTGTLGRSLGVSMSGGKLGGQPDIYESKPLGSRGRMGRFGSRLGYAPHVIGESQTAPFVGRWWTVKAIVARARQGVVRAFDDMARDLAEYLEGKRL